MELTTEQQERETFNNVCVDRKVFDWLNERIHKLATRARSLGMSADDVPTLHINERIPAERWVVFRIASINAKGIPDGWLEQMVFPIGKAPRTFELARLEQAALPDNLAERLVDADTADVVEDDLNYSYRNQFIRDANHEVKRWVWQRPISDRNSVRIPSTLTHNYVAKIADDELFIVSVTGTNPKLSGWSLAAVLKPIEVVETDDSGNRSGGGIETLVASLVDDLPTKYNNRTDSSVCDHCNKHRRRTETFVMRHEDGTHLQVGRQCLRDFLGHDSPESILRLGETLFGEWSRLLNQCTYEWNDNDASDGKGMYSVIDWVAYTCMVVRRYGYVSRKTSESTGKESTRWRVLGALQCKSHRDLISRGLDYPSANDWDWARNSVAWAKSIDINGASTFTQNLSIASRSSTVLNVEGFVTYLPIAYRRHLESLTEAKPKAKSSVHVGKVGERLELQLKVTFANTYEGDYGVRTLVILKDVDNNTYKWWASGEHLIDVGATARVKATVKAHELNNRKNNECVTVLQRVALVKNAAWLVRSDNDGFSCPPAGTPDLPVAVDKPSDERLTQEDYEDIERFAAAVSRA